MGYTYWLVSRDVIYIYIYTYIHTHIYNYIYFLNLIHGIHLLISSKGCDVYMKGSREEPEMSHLQYCGHRRFFQSTVRTSPVFPWDSLSSTASSGGLSRFFHGIAFHQRRPQVDWAGFSHGTYHGWKLWDVSKRHMQLTPELKFCDISGSYLGPFIYIYIYNHTHLILFLINVCPPDLGASWPRARWPRSTLTTSRPRTCGSTWPTSLTSATTRAPTSCPRPSSSTTCTTWPPSATSSTASSASSTTSVPTSSAPWTRPPTLPPTFSCTTTSGQCGIGS